MAELVRVFVSHHHSPEEDAFTARLVVHLEAAGADVWIDVVGVGAADFQERINEALATCNWFVLVLTPAAIASPWVEMEVHAAIRLKAQGRMQGIIQVMAQTVTQDQIPATWGIYAHFDATRDYAVALDQTLRELGLFRTSPSTSALPAHTAPPDRFPPLLTSLGYQVTLLHYAEVILPPVCDVPAGPFLMGSDPAQDKDARPEEQPQQWVTLGAYQIAKFPVTVAEFACCMRTYGMGPANWHEQRENLEHPVELDWTFAEMYTHWLVESTLQPWRLLSEAEWEKAARWDAATGTTRTYPWGNTFDASRCNTNESKKESTTPVGSYPSGASPYGVQDMSGNVWEWTNSPFKSYPYAFSDGRELAESSEDRVLRGGSCASPASDARAASRIPGVPYRSVHKCGFRLARSLPNS